MNIAIVEDQIIFQKELTELLEAWGKAHELTLNIQCFSSCQQFLDVFKSEYHIIFMDIFLPGENGMTTAAKIRAQNSEVPIVFVTSTSDYAMDGYDINALYYILKPIQQSGVDKCMNRVITIYTDSEYIAKLVNNQTARIRYSDIMYLESQGHYIIIYTPSSQFICRKKISQIKAELPSFFVQCHRSILVNINHVLKISRKEITVSTGQKVVMSESFEENITRKFIQCAKGALNWGVSRC